MKKTVFNKEQINMLLIMCYALFPEYIYIKENKDILRFSNIKKNSVNNLVADLFNIDVNTVHIHIFDLLYNQIPYRLSLRAKGNLSFAALYIVNAMYISTIDPSSVINYFYEEVFKKIENPYDINEKVNEAMEELRKYEEEEFDVRFEFLNLKDKINSLKNSPQPSHRKFRKLTFKEARNH